MSEQTERADRTSAKRDVTSPHNGRRAEENAAGTVDTTTVGTAGAAGTAAPPLRLTAAAAVAGFEGLAVAAWGVTLAVTGGAHMVLPGLFVLVLAALPLGAAYGLRRARRWSRGPALIMQLLSLPIAWTMLHSGGPAVAGGAVLGLLALGGLVLLVHPATSEALGIGRTAAS